MTRDQFDALLADATTMWSRRCDAATARAEAAETALAAMTARCDQMTSAWGKDAVKVEELTARNEALVGLVGRAQHIVPGFCPNWHKDARAALRTNATDASEGER